MKPHPYPDIAKAIIEGREVQIAVHGPKTKDDPLSLNFVWEDATDSAKRRFLLQTGESLQWRIKPDGIKARLYVYRDVRSSALRIGCLCDGPNDPDPRSVALTSNFVRWIDTAFKVYADAE